ncbi:DUF1496 domain-containing protein [Erwinia sp.]|uniref:DUF1496 domain-containing protein n=1 Tax=Erwinia citreus TaxID=558 RepID=UPI003C76BE2C
MKLTGAIMLTGLLLVSSSLYAEGQGWNLGTGHGNAGGNHNGNHQGNQGNSNTSSPNADVVVDMPPEVWTQGQNNNQPPCNTCCTYENRSYTEGSVVKMEGVLLQCSRDEKSYGTNNLIWKTLK